MGSVNSTAAISTELIKENTETDRSQFQHKDGMNTQPLAQEVKQILSMCAPP
eukprot:CAMPEP_0194599460 /NCGR_PEP_ID=MMETSP0292-20121207/27676_1 /TAXON_ID=39354 /ORGANISM="Heterosigma akashiwo, Strain CCMP2393" /LENGTH=51 /DNA_ID=CAMNT_0039460733 /DNA_START=596 /DNA_END=751 /DNA_ORIENTATION=-